MCLLKSTVKMSSYAFIDKKSCVISKRKHVVMSIDNARTIPRISPSGFIRPFKTEPAKLDKFKRRPSCSNCSEKATFDTYFELDDCIAVQKYCDICVQSATYEVSPR